MVSPYLAEFCGSLVFFGIVLLVIYWLVGYSSSFTIALLVGIGLFLGLLVCLYMGGPGYLNPALSVMGGVVQDQSASFIGGTIIAQFAAVAVLLLIFWFVVGSWNTRSSLEKAKAKME